MYPNSKQRGFMKHRDYMRRD